jgi:phospholipid/cholesterol/gamma-HCH transport system substrate-binding protein
MKKYSMETVVGIFVLIGIICIAYMTIKLGKVSLFGDSHYSIYAEFTSVSGLRIGNPVEIDGIQVGRVENLRIDQQKQIAVVTLRIMDEIKVYDDASAAIKTAGLIGDKFVKIDPGGAGNILKPGGKITETTSPIDIEDLIGKYAFGDLTAKKPNKSSGPMGE